MVVVDRSALGATATEFNQGVASPEKEKSHEVQFGDTPFSWINSGTVLEATGAVVHVISV
jgi:hypothetical protein